MTDYYVLIEDLNGPCKYFERNSGWDNFYICQNDETATSTIEAICKVFDPQKDYLYAILDLNLVGSKLNGKDFFESIINKFPNDSVYLICFSSNPEEFIKLLQDSGIARKFDFITEGNKPSKLVIDHINAHKTQRLAEKKSTGNPPCLKRTAVEQSTFQAALITNESEGLFRTAMNFFCCCCSNKPGSATVHLTTRSNDSI